MRLNVTKGVSLASLVILPLLALGFALLGRTGFWEVSSDFYQQTPTYLALLVALEAAQFGVVLFWKHLRIKYAGSAGVQWILWGVYQLGCGVALIQIFDASELWLASTVPIYAGFASIVTGAYLKTVSADKQA